MAKRIRVLVLWNFVGEDVYVALRKTGPTTLPWDESKPMAKFDTDDEEVQAIGKHLRRAGYVVRVTNLLDDFGTLASISKFRPDVVFNLVEIFGEDPVSESWVAGVYGLLGIPFTGNTPLCLATCQRKFRTKLILEAEGIPTAPYRLVERMPVPPRLGLRWPVIVKPAREDASGGVDLGAVVRSRPALETRVRRVLRSFKQPALIEEYIAGREIHVSILGNSPPRVLPLMENEWDPPKGRRRWAPQILSYKAKWDPTSPEFYAYREVVPARGLSARTERAIRDVALRAYRALGCRDYARVDMRLDTNTGDVFVLEVNPNPDLADSCAFAASAAASGRTYDKLICEIVDFALARAKSPVPAAAAGFDMLLREYQAKKRKQS